MIGENIRVKDMFEMSDENAEAIMRGIAELFDKHKTMDKAIKEVIAKYGEESVLAGMTLQRAIDSNNSLAQCDKASKEFAFGESLGLSDGESMKICKEVGNLTINNLGWKAAVAGVGRLFGERAVYAGAFLLFLYTRTEGEPVKKYDFGHG